MNRVLPILFNGDLVRAILDGRKTVTRRVMKPQPWKIGEGEYECKHEKGFFNMGENDWACRQCGCGVIPMKGGSYFHAPYQPGDILYVRETYKRNKDGYSGIDFGGYIYKADCRINFKDMYNPWHPSIHMPKAAARIWLKVTDVRVERLQDITEEQAQAEGCDSGMLTGPCTARGQFENLWNSTIKKSDLESHGWEANPWVWRIEFERCEKPESI